MTQDPNPPRLLELEDELPDDLRVGLSGLRSRVATPEQLMRMAAVVLPLSGASIGSATAATPTGTAGAAAGGAKVALVASLLVGAAGIGALVFWKSASRGATEPASIVAQAKSAVVVDRADPAGTVGGARGGSASRASSLSGPGTSADPVAAGANEPTAPGDAPASDQPASGSTPTAANGGQRRPDGSLSAAPGEAPVEGSAALVSGHRTASSPSTPRGPSTSGARVAAASTATADARRSGTTQDELQVLHDARAALASNPAQALRLADDHRRVYGTRGLGQEFELSAIEALVRLGNVSAARDRADRFRREFPNSPYRTKVDSIAGTP